MTNVLDLGDPATWPQELRSITGHAADACRDSTEYTNDLDVPEHLQRAMWEVLEQRRVRVYHCTRLTDAERNDITANGLVACSTELLADRIERLVQDGTFSRTVADALVAGSPLRDPRQQQGRLGRFCAVTTRRVLDRDVYGIRPFLRSWGGEIGYFWQEHNEDLRDLLRTVGVPAIVVLSLPAHEHPHGWYSDLPKILTGAVLGLDDVCGEVNYQVEPGERLPVEAIWVPGDPEYDRHVDLPRSRPSRKGAAAVGVAASASTSRPVR